MKAIAKVAPQPGAVELIDTSMPERAAGEAVIRITGAGICGTDVSIWQWTPAIARAYAPRLPNVMGHEFCGVVEEAEPGCGFQRGDRVVVNPQIACGACHYCHIGEQTLCDNRALMGGHINGGWTEFVSVPTRNLLTLPGHLDERVMPLVEPITVGVHSVFQRVTPSRGDVAVVIGPGPIGLIHALLLGAAGASLVVVCGLTRDRARLEVARAFGAMPVDVEVADIADAVLSHAPRGADVVYACSGAHTELTAASRVVRKGGRIATLGLPGEPSSLEVTPIVMRQIEIIGTRGYNDSTWPLTISWLEQLGDQALQLISHELPLGSFQEAFQLVERRVATKLVLTPEFGAMAPQARTSRSFPS